MGQASARGISWIDPRTRGRAEVADPSGLEAAHVSAHGGRGLVPVRVTVAWATPPREEGRAGRGGGQRGSRLRARGGVATPDAGEPGVRPVVLRGPRPARHPGRTECAYDPRREREAEAGTRPDLAALHSSDSSTALPLRRARSTARPSGTPLAPRPVSAPGHDVARGTGLSLPAHGPSSSRGSAPGFPFRGNSLLRQSDRPRAP